jgi:hypothetical protein
MILPHWRCAGPRIITLSAVFGLAACVPATPANVSSQSPTPPAPALPLELASLHPQDGATVCPRPLIGVDLLLTNAARKDGSFDLSSIALSLDGQDIAPAATVRETLTSPASRVSVLYTPGADLTLGEHQAQITYAATGSATVTWIFNVSGIACK